MQDIFRFVHKDLNTVTQQDAGTENQHNRFIIFWDEDIPLQLFGDTCCTEDCRMSVGDTGWYFTDKNMLRHLINSAQWSPVTTPTTLRGCNVTWLGETILPHKPIKVFWNPTVLQELCLAGTTLLKRRKSVSFDGDDVMVSLFEQVLFSCCLLNCRLVGFGLFSKPITLLIKSWLCNPVSYKCNSKLIHKGQVDAWIMLRDNVYLTTLNPTFKSRCVFLKDTLMHSVKKQKHCKSALQGGPICKIAW